MYAIETDSSPSGASPLTLTDHCGYTIENDRIVITIAEIANRRDPGDLSGTLAIELWALAQPYAGGAFTGTPLCGTSIGELRGRHVLTNCRYDLIFQAPPAGKLVSHPDAAGVDRHGLSHPRLCELCLALCR
jgi:hypothetical protein